MKVLVLTSAPGSNSTHRLIESIKMKKHTYEVYNPEDLYLLVSDSENGYDRIYFGSPELEKPIRLNAKDYDCVISRIGHNLQFGATIVEHLNKNLGIYTPSPASGLLTAQNKIKTTQRLSQKSIKTPRTIFASNPLHVDFLFEKLGGLPCVGKLLQGSQGKGVMMFETPLAANTSLESFAKVKIEVLLQEYIEGGAKDIRAIVIGDEVVVAMERTGKKDFRANISKGGSGAKIELTKEEKELCINASKAVGLEFSGVDIMRSNKNGQSYVIEVNGNAGDRIIGIIGVNYYDKLVEHCEKNYKRKENLSFVTPQTSPSVNKYSWFDPNAEHNKNASKIMGL
ncbi:MAG: RimK family alpha-L-glutamate ligase [Bacteroidota bacterium]|nr:RimK family alpha-L-glutamate ligase [Bacteroidota bacterium]